MDIGKDRLKTIFSNGLLGKKNKIPISFTQLERAASKKLPKEFFEYIYTGAGTNQGVANNTISFKRYRIKPPVLRGCETPQLQTKLLNYTSPLPLFFSPVGVLELAHPNADLELAHAATNTKLTMVSSNQASINLEECSKVLGSTNHWFQLYFSKSKKLVESFVQRAESSACSAIVLTLDTTTLGWRTMDLDNAFLPFIYGKGLAQYTSDPIFNQLMEDKLYAQPNHSKTIKPNLFKSLQILKSYPDSIYHNFVSKKPMKAIRCFLDIYSNPHLNWDDVAWLKSITKLPIILKGILREDDALKAMESGMDGIIVSNHGGRQMDQVQSSIDALPRIKRVVPADFPLFLDSGIRTGLDIFIALALGAKAVGLGRPYVYSLALAGHKGIEECIENLASELSIIMSLCGCKTIQDIHPDYLEC